MRTVSLADVLDVLFTAANREKTAKINMDSKTFFVHVDVPVPLAEELRAVQRRVIPNAAQRADIDHVTLVYTRKPTEDHPPDKVHAALAGLQQVGAQTPPIHAKVQGWGYFDGASRGGKTNTALVALLDAPGLEHLHVDMSRALQVHGIDPSDTHVFTPHITLGYLGEHGRTDTPLPAIGGRFTIDKVHVAARDRHVIPLNAQAKTADWDAATSTKEAMGERQWRRVEQALAKGGPQTDVGNLNNPYWQSALSPPIVASPIPTLRQRFDVNYKAPGYGRSDYDQNNKSYLRSIRINKDIIKENTPGAREDGGLWSRARDWLNDVSGSSAKARQRAENLLQEHKIELKKHIKANLSERFEDFANTDRLMASGRHSPQDVVDLPPINTLVPGQEHDMSGVHPDSVAWRASIPNADIGEGPRWFSGIPAVSAGYATTAGPTSRLQAYDYTNVPAEAQGPWTSHIAKDPRLPGTEATRFVFKSPIGASPIYEKVIDASHIPAPLSTYKPMATPFRFMRTQGPNLLRGELPAAASALPAVAKALLKHGETLGTQAAKFAARAGMRQITNALSAGETALAHRLATTPGVLKPSAAGSQIRHLGSGMEGTSTLVAHPQHGIAVRKVYDPQGISGPEMVARKAQAGAALQGNPNVAQFRGETPTQIGPAHFYEHVPGVSAPSARGTPSSAEVASQVRSQGAGSMRLHDVHEGNVVNGKVVDYLPVQPGAPTGLRTDVMARAEAASDAHRLGVNHAFTNYIKDPARPGNLMGQAFRGAAPLVQGQSPPQNPKWASLEVVAPNIYGARGY